MLKLECTDKVCFRICPAEAEEDTAQERSGRDARKGFSREGWSGRMRVLTDAEGHGLQEICCYVVSRWRIGTRSLLHRSGSGAEAAVRVDVLPAVSPQIPKSFQGLIIGSEVNVQAVEIVFSGKELPANCYRCGRIEIYTTKDDVLAGIRIGELTREEREHFTEELESGHPRQLIVRMAEDGEYDEELILGLYAGEANPLAAAKKEGSFTNRMLGGRTVFPPLITGGLYYIYRGILLKGFILGLIGLGGFMGATVVAAMYPGTGPGTAAIYLAYLIPLAEHIYAMVRFPKDYMRRFRKELAEGKKRGGFYTYETLHNKGAGNGIWAFIGFFALDFAVTIPIVIISFLIG